MLPSLSPQTLQAINGAVTPEKSGKKNRMEQSTEDFMSVLIGRTIEPMFPQDDEESMIFGGGNGGDIYRSLMVQEFGKILSKNGLLRSVDASVQQQLIALQEQNHG